MVLARLTRHGLACTPLCGHDGIQLLVQSFLRTAPYQAPAGGQTAHALSNLKQARKWPPWKHYTLLYYTVIHLKLLVNVRVLHQRHDDSND